MAKKTVNDEYPQLCADIRAGKLAPVYLLHGEESYYIDQLTQLLLDNVLTEDEKDFNLQQFYGADSTLSQVIESARSYPMFGERQLVILREMQSLDSRLSANDTEILATYLSQPQPSTILVLCHKNKKADGTRKWVKAIKKVGVVYESQKVPEYGNILQGVVAAHLREQGLNAEPQAIDALCDAIGNDLSRLFSEIDKLRITVAANKITLAQVLQHVGVSKEFNVYELQDAVAQRNVQKVERIRRYFVANPKAAPFPVLISTLFGFFSNLMLAHYTPDKSIDGLKDGLKLNFPQAKNLVQALKIYNAWKTMNNIAIIREFDARSKGARGGASVSDGDLMQELFYKLMH